MLHPDSNLPTTAKVLRHDIRAEIVGLKRALKDGRKSIPTRLPIMFLEMVKKSLYEIEREEVSQQIQRPQKRSFRVPKRTRVIFQKGPKIAMCTDCKFDSSECVCGTEYSPDQAIEDHLELCFNSVMHNWP